MATAGLNLDLDGLDRVAELLTAAGLLLGTGLDEEVPPCGGDAVSIALFHNLNARLRWLIGHVRAGHAQASAAADTVTGNALAYRSEDAAAAATLAGSAPVAGSDASAAAPSVAPPGALPTPAPLPDISGTEGEELARALEAGAGPGPALAVAARLSTLAAQVGAASAQLTAAQAQLVAAGDSALHAPLLARLLRATTWCAGVSAHAGALATAFSTAAGAFTATRSVVGPSPGWSALKVSYREAIARNVASMGLNKAEVDGYKVTLAGWQQQSSDAVSSYKETGDAASTVVGELPDPGLDPNRTGERGVGDAGDPSTTELAGTAEGAANPLEELGGIQELLSPLLGSFGSLGQANPLQAVGQLGQQLAQQVGQLAQQAGNLGHHQPVSPIKANPLASTHLSGAHGGGSKGINPGAGIPGASHPASAPPATPATSTGANGVNGKPAAASPNASSGGGSGMGMMPMSRGAGGGAKAVPVSHYPGELLAEVPSTGTPGVVPEAAQPQPAVDASTKQSVLDRIAKRKKVAAGDDE